MLNESFYQKPLIEQIYNELLSNIERHEEFDNKTIQALKELAERGELNKFAKISEAISHKLGKEDEITGTGS